MSIADKWVAYGRAAEEMTRHMRRVAVRLREQDKIDARVLAVRLELAARTPYEQVGIYVSTSAVCHALDLSESFAAFGFDSDLAEEVTTLAGATCAAAEAYVAWLEVA